MSALKHQPYTAFKLWLAGHGITYKDVADVIDCAEATVQMKINGASDFTFTEGKKMQAAFGFELGIFFDPQIA